MKTLKEHQREKRPIARRRVSSPNGIECPRCKSELHDVNNQIQLMSYPPQYRIMCLECDWRGSRF